MAIHTFTDRNESQPKTTTPNTSVDITDFDIPELQRTLKLAGLLQTSLEVENILEFFIDSIRDAVPFASAEYNFADLNLKHTIGKSDRHSCAYRLRIAGDDLGELKFTRNKKFAEEEMESIENLIYHLVYPLRNAIAYQKALQAAQMDSLTGINNRRHFIHLAENPGKNTDALSGRGRNFICYTRRYNYTRFCLRFWEPV